MNKTTWMRRLLVVVLCIASLMLTACGSKELASSNSESTDSAATDDTAVNGDVTDNTTADGNASETTNGNTTYTQGNSTTATDKTTTGASGNGATTQQAQQTNKTDKLPTETTGSLGAATTTDKKTTTTTKKEPDEIYTGCQLVVSGGERYVADMVLTARNGVDPTGKTSSTDGIQRALNAVSTLGGGTVYLPAGTYLIDGQITIPSFVTLLGDWRDPDKGQSGGTVLLIHNMRAGTTAGCVVYLHGSSGVSGLTFYFPGQNIRNVQAYPPVFRIAPSMLQTIKNVHLVNAYTGIVYEGKSGAHEMLTVDNVKGTVLNCGAEIYNQADVGTWRDVSFSSSYWANAKDGMNTAKQADIKAYTRKNAVGIRAGDLEWTEFLNIKLSDFRYGLQVVKGVRIEFAGSLYNAKITNRDQAIRVESLDTRWGMLVANSTLSGSEYAVYNQTGGVVKMCGVTTSGELYGTVKAAETDVSSLAPADATHAVPGNRLYIVEEGSWATKDASAAIQKQLDAAGKTGGVVYLPSGFYLLEKALVVPAGVELRGSSSVSVRGVGGVAGGTVLLVRFGRAATAASAESGVAAVTLDGKNAGIRGIQMVYPEELTALNEKTSLPWTYAIRGKASGVYAVDVCLVGAYNGIDFRNCDNHYIRRAVTCCLNNTMFVGGKNGVVEDCLQNATVLCRASGSLYYTPFNEANIFTHVFNPVTRVNTVYTRVQKGAQNQRVTNTFAYGVHTFVANEGNGTVLCNVGADNLGGVMLSASAGSINGVNIMRWNGSSYNATGSAIVHLYNRLTINNKNEPDF